MCVCGVEGGWIDLIYCVHVLFRGSEDNLKESVFSLHHVGTRNQSHVFICGSKCSLRPFKIIKYFLLSF